MKKFFNKAKYYAYLNSPEWRLKRQQLFLLRGKKCERCGSGSGIQVHHRTYANIFNEKMEDLEVLCVLCHARHHEQEKAVKKILSHVDKQLAKNQKKRVKAKKCPPMPWKVKRKPAVRPTKKNNNYPF